VAAQPPAYQSVIDVPAVQAALRAASLDRWADALPAACTEALQGAHGRLPEWQDLLRRLPHAEPANVRLDENAVRVGTPGGIDPSAGAIIDHVLKQLSPWRKGPFSIHGVSVDSEWRSDRKWARIAPHLAPLEGRVVLDVGAGNGYYAWRMAGAGARTVIGIDPTWLYLVQFAALRHFLGTQHPVHLLPLGIEDVPGRTQGFDTVFSMGVLYHRRSPLDHLLELYGALKPGGELVLETLVVEGAPGMTLLPAGRYAKMRNVWFIPSISTLELWLARCGFRAIRIVDVTPTTVAEQRATQWMTFESLADFLDPQDASRTVEGYPAPLRAFAVARRSAGS
jgi:tRNA (mo5U34)-methyltransferase